MTGQIVCIWRHIWNAPAAGLEYLSMGIRSAQGTIVWTDETSSAYRLSYGVEWDENWRTRVLSVNVSGLGVDRSVDLTSDEEGRWYSGGEERRDLIGCVDVDLWPTPFTNSLPVRRLRLSEGVAAEIRVVYVEAPDLSVSAKAQRYTGQGGGFYRFESLEDGFTSEIELDEQDLVRAYPGLFERIV